MEIQVKTGEYASLGENTQTTCKTHLKELQNTENVLFLIMENKKNPQKNQEIFLKTQKPCQKMQKKSEKIAKKSKKNT